MLVSHPVTNGYTHETLVTKGLIVDEDYSLATCDACGISVRAMVVIALPSGRNLTYCGHHARKYASAAEAMGALVVELTPA